MHIQPVHLPRRHSLSDLYIHDFERVSALYEYPPYRQDSFDRRWQEVTLAENRADRSALAEALHAYNERVNRHEAVLDNIRLLERRDSVVVIGGQQAGVMTGPLYTISKAVTILQLAREQQEKLGVPVVPVFWIAGEDHDLLEVNHVWVSGEDMRLRKVRMGRDDGFKRSIGLRPLTLSEVDTFLKAVADAHPDSHYKNTWLHKLRQLAEQSKTWSDWFARIFHWFFARAGLVLFDSAAGEFKRVAVPFYARLIEEAERLNEAVLAGTRHVEQFGFRPQVEVLPQQVNLFVEENGERRLLLKQGDAYTSKGEGAHYTASRLKDLACTQPEKFSTNVVSRPLLQDYLFPTLACVLGPGEIAYWGQYGQAFSLFGHQMPVLYPRVGFTLVERPVAKTMQSFDLSPIDAMFRLDDFREQWLRTQEDIDVEALFSQLAEGMAQLHETTLQPLRSVNRGVEELAAKNRERILRELEYLEGQVQKAIRLKHRAVLQQFDRVQLSLMPHGKLQERVYNVFRYVNLYGRDWLDTLIGERLDLTHSHYMVYL